MSSFEQQPPLAALFAHDTGPLEPDRNVESDRIPTGAPFLEAWMEGGGAAAGDVSGILGPTGSGKTILGMQAAVGAAEHFAQCCPSKAAYFCSFQSDKRDLMIRSRCKAARIKKEVLERGEGFSRMGKLKPYEQTLFAELIAQGKEVPGEWERYHAAEPWVSKHLDLIDFSLDGQGNTPLGVHPIVRRVADRIEADFASSGMAPGLICIDTAEIGVRQYLFSHDDVQTFRVTRLLAGLAAACRSDLAERFGCPVWLVHNLREMPSKSAPTIPRHHSDAGWARKFGNELDFAFVLGTKDPLSSCCLLSCTKARRRPNTPPTIIVHVNGAFAELVDVTNRHVIDHKTQQIVPVEQFRYLDVDDNTAQELEAIAAERDLPRKIPGTTS